MPPLRHFLSGSAISIAVTFAVPFFIGIIPLNDELPRPIFFAIFIIGLLSTGIAYTLTAYQAEKAEKTSERMLNTIQDLIGMLNELRNEAQNNNDKNIVKATKELRSIPGYELKQLTEQVVKKMRSMGDAFHAAAQQNYKQTSMPSSSHATPEHWRMKWHQDTEKLITLSEEHNNRWRNDLHPQAVAVWRELQRRVYGAPPYPKDNNATALEYGILAGPTPLSMSAIALEQLARELPD